MPSKPLPDHRFPAPMSRVVMIAPEHRVRAMLVALAESGSAQLVGPLPAAEGEAVDALRRLERAHPQVAKAAPRVWLTCAANRLRAAASICWLPAIWIFESEPRLTVSRCACAGSVSALTAFCGSGGFVS